MATDDSIAAMETALRLLEAARAKLREIIAVKLVTGEDDSFERNEVASLDREINDLRELLGELRAGRLVIPAPSSAEILAAKNLLDELVKLTVEDAMVAGGLELLKAGLKTARELGSTNGSSGKPVGSA